MHHVREDNKNRPRTVCVLQPPGVSASAAQCSVQQAAIARHRIVMHNGHSRRRLMCPTLFITDHAGDSTSDGPPSSKQQVYGQEPTNPQLIACEQSKSGSHRAKQPTEETVELGFVTSSSQLWSGWRRQLIISQLASITAWDPGLAIKNQRTQGSRLNDPKISAGFTGSGFPPQPLDKSRLPSFAYSSGGIEFIKPGNNGTLSITVTIPRCGVNDSSVKQAKDLPAAPLFVSFSLSVHPFSRSDLKGTCFLPAYCHPKLNSGKQQQGWRVKCTAGGLSCLQAATGNNLRFRLALHLRMAVPVSPSQQNET
ncbi:unnamed protein product [Pleuronectes platessa]|uniref:Uncharacterized protein n=1 Tax=Pleuronectes platessa TaxID=8262 RepID=A0A9N7YRT0_PLEPL|nr:unnamed protein product [Pleuronectes platessa]